MIHDECFECVEGVLACFGLKYLLLAKIPTKSYQKPIKICLNRSNVLSSQKVIDGFY